MASLGITLNNPCNIRYNSLNHWKGQIGYVKGFCKFSSVDYGLRAVLCLLRTYRYVYGLDTVRKIISRYAPVSENNSDSYISFIVSTLHETGVFYNADSKLYFDFYDYAGVTPLYYFVKGMCLMESNFVLTPEQFKISLKLLHS